MTYMQTSCEGAEFNRLSREGSLSQKIFRTVLAFTLAIIFALTLILTSIYYWSHESAAEEDLAAQARDAAAYLNATASAQNVPVLKEQFAGMVRYTLIASDGTVLFDSTIEDVSSMENHANRPEVKAADRVGEGAVSRYSSTAQTDTIYAAVKLEDGSIVRLAETRESLLAFLSSLMLPMLLAMLLAAGMASILSRVLTARIMRPIDALDLSNPLGNGIYVEMQPLLARVDEQQRQLREQNRELALAESMRRDFSANVSHEMKTPLQVISGYAELIKAGIASEADTRKFAGLIYDESQTMRQLINDVLTLSRLDEPTLSREMAPVNLTGVAERVKGRLLSFADERGVRVEVEGCCGEGEDGRDVLVLGTETLLEEAVYNLVENGIRYSGSGGVVRVSLRYEYDIDDLRFAILSVSDTGQGIPQEEQGKIFERFYRMEKSRSKETGGTGLGLAIVKHVVLQHRGTVSVESRLGEGSTFTVRIPALDLDPVG